MPLSPGGNQVVTLLAPQTAAVVAGTLTFDLSPFRQFILAMPGLATTELGAALVLTPGGNAPMSDIRNNATLTATIQASTFDGGATLTFTKQVTAAPVGIYLVLPNLRN